MKHRSSALITAAFFLFCFEPLYALDDGIAAAPVIQGRPRAVCVDSAGTRYVTGFFFSERDFNPGTGIIDKTSVGNADVFVSSIKPDGSVNWVQTFGGTGDDEGNGIVIVGSTVYVVGKFSSTNAGFGAAGTFASAGSSDAFVLALNSADGKPVTTFGKEGVVVIGGTFAESATGVASDGKTIYVAGGFGSATISGAGATATQTGGLNGFILALDSTGNAVSTFGTKGIQTLGGAGFEVFTGLALFGGTVYASGYASADNVGIGGLGDLKTLGKADAVVVALDAKTGAERSTFGHNGIKLIGGSNDDLGTSVAVTADALYVGGTLSSTDAGIGALGSVSTAGDADGFVAALNPFTGAALPAFGNAGIAVFGGSARDGIAGVAVTSDRVFAAGSFESSNAGFGSLGVLKSSGNGDAMILALDRFSGTPTSGTLIYGGADLDAAFGVTQYLGKGIVVGDLFSVDAGVNGPGTGNGSGFFGFLFEDDPANFVRGTDLTSADADGDGFPDDLEAQLFTDPFDVNSTPAHGLPAVPHALTVTKLSLKLSFATPDPRKDSLSLSATLPAAQVVNGKTVYVYVGGILKAFVLSAKGASAKSKTSSLKISKGKVTAKLSGGSYRDYLDDEKLTGTADLKSANRTVLAGLLIDADFYSSTVKLKYSAKKDTSGSASGPAK